MPVGVRVRPALKPQFKVAAVIGLALTPWPAHQGFAEDPRAFAGEAFVLDDAPVEMRLPILPPLGLPQKHRDKDSAMSRRSCESDSP